MAKHSLDNMFYEVTFDGKVMTGQLGESSSNIIPEQLCTALPLFVFKMNLKYLGGGGVNEQNNKD